MNQFVARKLYRLLPIIIGCVAVFAHPHSVRADKGGTASSLTPAQRELLDNKLCPAISGSDFGHLLRVTSGIVAKLDDTQLGNVNAYLRDRKYPRIERILAVAYLQVARDAADGGGALPKGRELIAVMEGINDWIFDFLLVQDEHPAFRDRGKPRSLDEYEGRLWELHVLRNQLRMADDLVAIGKRLAKERVGTAASAVDQRRGELASELNELNLSLQKLKTEVECRALAIRANRIAFADEVLTNDVDLVKRFKAAFAVQWDLADLQDHFREFPPSDDVDEENSPPIDLSRINHSTIATTKLVREIQSVASHAKQVAGDDLLTKSHHLYNGIYWWFRGRYGIGTDAGGLLKSKNALKSRQAMFALQMPKVLPKPTVPRSQEYSFPLVERRHNHLWETTHSASLVNTGTCRIAFGMDFL